MVTMKTYRLTQTATVLQYKDVEAPEGADEEDIIESSWGIPWKTAKTINSEGIEVEEV